MENAPAVKCWGVFSLTLKPNGTMSSKGFVERLLDNTNRIYQVSLKQFDWWKKVQGTKVQVVRIKESSSYRAVYGSIANSTLPDDSQAEKFPYVVLISMNDIKRIFAKTQDPLQFMDNQDVLRLGDILTFARGSQEYKWKITEVMTFSESADVIHTYTITGLNEVNATKKL